MATAWRGMDPLAGLSNESEDESTGDGEVEHEGGKEVKSEAESAASKKDLPKPAEKPAAAAPKKPSLDFAALAKHGFTGGPSILYVPPPQEAGEQSWQWGQGKRKAPEDEEERESFAERERLRDTVNEKVNETAAQAVKHAEFVKKQKADAAAERRALSFAQKEKKKRDMGQASRGKSYVEEEKRLLRESGVYSGFDT